MLPKCEKYQFPEGVVLGFYIPISDKKPIYFNNPTNTFIRSASGDQRASKEEVDALFRDQAFGTQSAGEVPGTSILDLHENSLQQYREYLNRNNPASAYNRLTEDEFLQKLRVVVKGVLTYSGLLFFGKNDAIQAIFPDFRIDYLEIPGTSYNNASVRYTYRVDEKENLWDYYFVLFHRLRRQLDLPFKLTTEGFATEDYPQLNAIREGLVNFLMHSDYFSPSKPRIRVFDDRIEFFNPGALPKPLDKIMAEDISMPRNPIIAKFFRVVKLAENAGFGFDKMKDGWFSYTKTEPVFEQGQDFTKASFYFELNKEDDKMGASGGSIGGSNSGSNNEDERYSEDFILTRRQKEVLALIKSNPSVGYREIGEVLGINQSAAQKHFESLKEKGVIERIGPAKGGYWRVKV